MTFIRNAVIWTTLISGLLACAAQSELGMSLEEKLVARNFELGESVDRIRKYNINGWSVLDSTHIILNAGASDHYLVNLRRRCDDLNSAIDIAFTSTAGNLTRADRIIVNGPGNFTNHCYILSFTRLYKNKRKPDSQ